MIDSKIFQLLRRVFGFISNNPFCFCVILGAAYFLYWLVSNGLLYGADTSNKIAGIFTPLIVGGVTAYVAWNQYKLAQRQHELAREQKSLTERQAHIAAQQSQTAKNKLILDLFDKRYDVYEVIINVERAVNNLSYYIDGKLRNSDLIEEFLRVTKDTKDSEFERKKLYAEKKMKELNSNIGKIEFLFNERAYYLCIEIINNVSSYLSSAKFRYKDNCISYYENDYPVECYLPQINERYNELKDILKQYVDLSKIL